MAREYIKKKKNMRKLSTKLMHPQAFDYKSSEPTKTRKQKQMRLKLQQYHHQLNQLIHHPPSEPPARNLTPSCSPQKNIEE